MEQEIYTILSEDDTINNLVVDRIFPVVPTQDTELPYLVYYVSGIESVGTLQGRSDITKYELSLDYWGEDFSEIAAIATGLRTLLDGYRDAPISGIFLTEQSVEQEVDAYHGRQIYYVWIKDA